MNLSFPPNELLRAALLVSMTSVWVLVGLFYYLNRYTRRRYFTTWTAAWLFHALWLTLELVISHAASGSWIAAIRACCVAVCALFLLWGSLEFLQIKVSERLFGLFMLFLIVWATVSPSVLSGSLQTQLPVSILLGAGSIFAGGCFFRLRRKLPFVGAGMLSLGFLLWGIHLACYPLTQNHAELRSSAIFLAAILQLFIAVSMIVLVLEEVRYKSEQTLRELTEVRMEKADLEVKMITTEEQCRTLYDRVRAAEGIEKAYQELRRTQQAVVQQERLRVLGQIASGVSHDVNNALAPILAYAEALRASLTSIDEGDRRKIKTIHKCAHDIARIVVRMRDLYRQRGEDEALEMVDVPRIMEEVVELTRPRWRDLPQRRGVTIQCLMEVEPGLPQLLSDATELREALTNLIFNSVDALPEGGTITLRARTQDNAEDGQTGQSVVVEVLDDGIGMDEKTRERCTEPFYTTKWASGGSGLGLAMVSGMIQRHQASIAIESQRESGTAIRLIFPVRQLPAAETKLPAVPPAPNRSLRILCVDDETDIRDMLQTCLGSFDHDVVAAENGRLGLELFANALKANQPFNVVITDLGMPTIDGLQVARGIKNTSPTTPVVMMTGWATEMKEKSENSSHVDAIVAKPCSMTELNTILQNLTRPGFQN
jgi:signal transduction histidine kinase/ActR/RegA family two-component response regulator